VPAIPRSGVRDFFDTVQCPARRNLIVSALNEMGLPCHLPRSSFSALRIQSTGLSAKGLARKLLEAEKVAGVPGSASGPTGEGCLRCCFATAPDRIEIAVEGVERFAKRVRSGPCKDPP
jgi:aminotransferase